MKPILAGMLSVSGTALTDKEKYLLSTSNPLGISLFKRNIANKEQVKALVQSIKEVIGRDDVLVAVDQEGGQVQRFSEPEWPLYLSQYALGSLPEKEAVELTQLHACLIANDLQNLGINWNYAPVMDVSYPQTTTALSSRIFSSDEKKVALLGRVLVEEYQKVGICPCVKHLPGHGRAEVDPHLMLPVLNQKTNELEKDFYPFEAISDCALAGMTAHILIKDIDDKPVTQSKKAIDKIIRGRIGFNGFLISDAIDMKALSGTLTQRIKASLEAGCDAICYCFGIESELEEVVHATSPLTDEAMDRLSRIKGILKNRLSDFDKAAYFERYMLLAKKTKSLSSDYDTVETLHLLADKK